VVAGSLSDALVSAAFAFAVVGVVAAVLAAAPGPDELIDAWAFEESESVKGAAWVGACLSSRSRRLTPFIPVDKRKHLFFGPSSISWARASAK